MTPVPPAIPAAVFETRLPYRLGVTYRTLRKLHQQGGWKAKKAGTKFTKNHEPDRNWNHIENQCSEI